MIYIRDNGERVELAGEIANEYMLTHGFVAYEGEIPSYDLATQKLVLSDGSLKVVDIEVPKEKVEKISLRQCKLLLNKKGLLAKVQEYIDSLDEATKAEVKIEWEYANDVELSNPLIKVLQTKLSLSDEQIEQMFVEASKI